VDIRHAARPTGVLSRLRLAALIALCAWFVPGLAATGVDMSCERSANSSPLPQDRPDQLMADVVDHRTAGDVPLGDVADGASADERPTARASDDSGPRVDVMLRRIFDEPQLRAPEAARPQQSDLPAPPLAVDKSETVDDGATGVEPVQDNDAATPLPGVSGDELMRYRQRMFRTDI